MFCTWFGWRKIDSLLNQIQQPTNNLNQAGEDEEDASIALLNKQKKIQMLSAVVWFPSMVFLSTQSLINIGFSVIALVFIYPFYLYILYPVLVTSEKMNRWRRTSLLLVILINPIFIILFVKIQQTMVLPHLGQISDLLKLYSPIPCDFNMVMWLKGLNNTEIMKSYFSMGGQIDIIGMCLGYWNSFDLGKLFSSMGGNFDILGMWVNYLKNDSNYNPVVFIFLIFIYLPFNLVTIKVFMDS